MIAAALDAWDGPDESTGREQLGNPGSQLEIFWTFVCICCPGPAARDTGDERASSGGTDKSQ
jgi:hypothetical protein